MAAFVLIERRAAEPVLPLRLFGDSIFRVSSAASAIVGFAMFGAMTFLPLFLQTVHLVSPTLSGLQLLPIMAFVLTMSIWSGRRIAKKGRYRPYPIAGTIILTLGFWGLAEYGINLTAPYWRTAIFMAMIGAGLGLTMQVLVLSVQNSVDYRDLGVATSAATFFRSIGGSLGVAVFGEIFANRLAASLPAQLRAAQANSGGIQSLTPAQLKEMKRVAPVQFDQLMHAFNHALHIVFVAAVPFSAVCIILALMLREVPLRRTTGRGPAMDAADSQAMQESPETAVTPARSPATAG
jgi:MFS family permease